MQCESGDASIPPSRELEALPLSDSEKREQIPVCRGSAPAYLITNGLGMWYHQSGDQPDLKEAAGELAERTG